MIEEIRNLLDEYTIWLRDNTFLRQANSEWIEITTPHLDRHNDAIQIYAKKAQAGYLLTDDGNTIEDLASSGCKLESRKRKELLHQTLAGFGVRNVEGRLEVTAARESFPLRKHNLLQAILAVNDLFYLAETTITSLFLEDVTAWLDLVGIRCTPNVKFSGKSGYDHMFSFVIPKSRNQPERIIEAINRPGRDTAESMAFKWIDTHSVRPSDCKAYALLNDTAVPVPSSVSEALRNYNTIPILWSERETAREELAA